MVRISLLCNNEPRFYYGGPEFERGESEGPRIAASLFLNNHKRGIFSYRTPAFNHTPAFKDPSRCQPVIGQIESRI